MADGFLTSSQVLEQEFVTLHGPTPLKADPPPLETGNPERDKSAREKYDRLRLEALFKAVHSLDPCRSALCLSGGGIRSATFSLGVIQGLAHAGWLEKFHYLSTVSGGGYIGGWLSAWIQRQGFKEVLGGLCTRQAASASDVSPEPQEIRWLRSLSNYLSPRIGWSIDCLTLIGSYLRNLLLHWVVFIPLLAAALMLPRGTYALTSQLDPPDPVRWVALVLAFIFGAAGLAFVDTDLPGSNRKPCGRFTWFFLLPTLAGAFFLSLFWAWHTQRINAGEFDWLHCAGFGAAINALGVFGGFIVRRWRRFSQQGSENPPAGANLPFRQAINRFIFRVFVILSSGALGGAVLWFGSTKIFPRPLESKGSYACFAVPFLFAALSIGTVLYIGLFREWTEEEDREWWASAGGWVIMTIALWAASHGLVIYGPPALLSLSGRAAAAIVSLGGLTGVATAVWAYWSKIRAADLGKRDSGLWRVLARVGPRLGTLIFLLTLLVWIAFATSLLLDFDTHQSWGDGASSQAQAYRRVLEVQSAWRFWGVWGGCLTVAGVFLRMMGINTFSLNSMYGNRLVRAYLGASNKQRNPHPFTGFDRGDNLSLKDLKMSLGTEKKEELRGPMHVVNLTLNLVKADRLEWQQRKAESFTVSPLHSGSLHLGYQYSESYGGKNGMSLGKAITISGAAASPNMGYHSSTLVAFLMAFFNVRLGWWLPNPGRAGKGNWRRSEPHFGIIQLFAEALGRTTDKTPYVYLSDGGHFENLALYEMVFRRCGLIVLVDAGCDPKYEYEDLAGAVRKIRADLGIPITFSQLPRPGDEKRAGSHYALGKIHYTNVGEKRDGTIIYIKPVLAGDEEVDVKRYAQTHNHPKNPFPQQSTMDQFFDEVQFESYRRLGEHSVRRLVAGQHGDAAWVFSSAFDGRSKRNEMQLGV
jgi:hypothetical protein